VSNFCIDLETGRAFIYERTLETDYLQGRFGAVPNINVRYKAQYFHHSMDIVDPKKLAGELRALAERLEKSVEGNK
jgi:hypothetical protein